MNKLVPYIFAVFANSCFSSASMHESITSNARETTVEKVLASEEKRAPIEIPIPPNPYEDNWQCEQVNYHCPTLCSNSSQMGELRALLLSLKSEAQARFDAASEAILTVGPQLVSFKEWREVAVDLMKTLIHPIVIVVQLRNGEWKKVSFQDLKSIHAEETDISQIYNTVSGKIKGALIATMIAHNIPYKTAESISSTIVRKYTEKTLASTAFH